MKLARTNETYNPKTKQWSTNYNVNELNKKYGMALYRIWSTDNNYKYWKLTPSKPLGIMTELSELEVLQLKQELDRIEINL